jgi:beta-ribofuranosylaminobenzene 5'-phosphate synthase
VLGKIASAMRIQVSAPARLHLGDIDPFAIGRFGYAPILAIEEPRTVVKAEVADSLVVSGEEVEEAEIYVQRVLEAFKLKGAHVEIERTAPRHAGFGSTTQLSLAIGRAVTLAYGVDTSLHELVKSVRRTSTGGLYTFEYGGLIVSGGFKSRPEGGIFIRDDPLIPPIILRSCFPDQWRFVIVRPTIAPMSPDGEAEEQAFEKLLSQSPPVDLTRKAYFLLAAKLLPALMEKDAEAFGSVLSKIQETVGRIYQPVQGSVFNPGSEWLISMLKRSDETLGYGQTSWGPTVYAFTDGADPAERIKQFVEAEAGERAAVSIVGPDNEGARVQALS